MQVDECRIATADKLGGGGNTTPVSEGWDRPLRHDPERAEFYATRKVERIAKSETLGRWPANICLSPTGGEYELRPGVTDDQKRELYRWLSENP